MSGMGMARLPRIVFEGALYRVTFRGNGGQDVFLDLADFERMQVRMGAAVKSGSPVGPACTYPLDQPGTSLKIIVERGGL